MANVSLQIKNGLAGGLAPIWISLRTELGQFLSPVGWSSHFSIDPGIDSGARTFVGGVPWFAITGSCELPGGVGNCILSLSSAPAVWLQEVQLNLFEGRLAIRLDHPVPIGPWVSVGFWASDLRVHNFSESAIWLECLAGQLQITNLLAVDRLPDQFSGSCEASLAQFSGNHALIFRSGCLVVGNTLNQHEALGNLGLLDSHRPVFPLRFGEEGTLDDWSLLDWTGQCHRKRGVTTWVDLSRDKNHQGEALCALFEGDIDIFEIVDFNINRLGGVSLWYDILDAGFFVPLGGGSGRVGNDRYVGSLRTLSQMPKDARELDGDQTLAAWVGSVKSGKTTATCYPLVSISNIANPNGISNSVVRVIVAGLTESTQLELIGPGGQVLIAKNLKINFEHQEWNFDLPGTVPPFISARLKNSSAQLLAQTSALRLNSTQLDYDATSALLRLVDRLSAMKSWIENHADSMTESAKIFRKALCNKWLLILQQKMSVFKYRKILPPL